MKNLIKATLIILSLFNLHLTFADNMEKTTIEILTWESADGVSDEAMIEAVNNLVPDLKELPGFINQSLYKNPEGKWVDVYYWTNAEDAHASNERMTGKESLNKLMELLKPETITMEVMDSHQASEEINFN